MSPRASTPPLSIPAGPPTSVILERLERELREMWNGPTQPGDAPKVRVVTMNLVVAAQSKEIADRYTAIVDEVTAGIPSRAIVVSLEGDAPTRALAGSVTAVCTPGEGGDGTTAARPPRGPQQVVCSERVRLDAAGSVCARMGSAVEALLIPEIATTLVWLGRVHVDDDVFVSMARNAQRVVLDTEYTSLASLLSLVRWARDEPGRADVADLAWTRLATWQELCARFFDEPSFVGHASAITKVTVQQASDVGARLGSEGALLLGWMATRLGWRATRMGGALRIRRPDGKDVQLQLGVVSRPDGVAPAALAAVSIEAVVDGKTLRGTIDRELGSGAEMEGKTVDADVVTWRLEVDGHASLAQRVRLRANRGARVLDRTLHRPVADPALVESVQFAEHFLEDGVIAR